MRNYVQHLASKTTQAKVSVAQWPVSQSPCRWCRRINCAEIMHQILADQAERPSLRPQRGADR